MPGKRWIILLSCLPVSQKSSLVDGSAHSFGMATESSSTSLNPIANGKAIVRNLDQILVSDTGECWKEVNMRKYKVTRAATTVQSSHQNDAVDNLREHRRRITAMVATASNVAVKPYNRAVRL